MASEAKFSVRWQKARKKQGELKKKQRQAFSIDHEIEW